MILVGGPGSDIRRCALVFAIGLNPFKDFSITFACGEFFFHGFGIDAGKFEKVLVQRTGVMVFAVLAVDRCAPFIEATGEDNITTEPHARTARRLFREIK